MLCVKYSKNSYNSLYVNIPKCLNVKKTLRLFISNLNNLKLTQNDVWHSVVLGYHPNSKHEKIKFPLIDQSLFYFNIAMITGWFYSIYYVQSLTRSVIQDNIQINKL